MTARQSGDARTRTYTVDLVSTGTAGATGTVSKIVDKDFEAPPRSHPRELLPLTG